MAMRGTADLLWGEAATRGIPDATERERPPWADRTNWKELQFKLGFGAGKETTMNANDLRRLDDLNHRGNDQWAADSQCGDTSPGFAEASLTA